jgi:uncharacterized protein with HEPN domain
LSRDKDALLDIVWNVIRDDLPTLRQQIAAIVDELE